MPHVSQHLNDLSVLEGHWSLDPARTTVEFHTKIMRVIPVKGTIKASEGRVNVVTDGSIDGTLILDVATIDTGIKKRDNHLRTADFFDADKYPTIAFTTHSARRLPSGEFEVAGNLALHGQAQPLVTILEMQYLPAEVSISACVDLDRTAWGVGRTRLGPSNAARVLVTARFVRD